MKYFFTSIFFFLSFIGSAQQFEWTPSTREIVVTCGDSTIRAKVLIKKEKITLFETKMYYWYNKGQINKNMGGYAGELLHGEYFVYNRQKHLVTQGAFEKGLKVGKWKFWYPDGKLHLIENYKHGLLNGEQLSFDVNGNLIAKDFYKHGKLQQNHEKTTKQKSKNNYNNSDTLPEVNDKAEMKF